MRIIGRLLGEALAARYTEGAQLHDELAAKREGLEAVRQHLRAKVGPRACEPDETFHFPAHVPDFVGYTAETTEHVDAFLYDDGDVDELVELSAEEEMAREMEAARREAEAMMASFQAAHEESKEAPPADVEAPQPSATGPRRLAPAFEQHASPARGGQHHSSSRGGQHASSLRSGARRKKRGPARRAPGH